MNRPVPQGAGFFITDGRVRHLRHGDRNRDGLWRVMSEATKGIVAILLANLIWGLSPLFYKMFAHVPPLEVLSHRTIWSLVFLA